MRAITRVDTGVLTARDMRVQALPGVAGTGTHAVTPSKAVDEARHLPAWNVYLFVWNGFAEVIGKPLHHDPTQGAQDTSQAHHIRVRFRHTASALAKRRPPEIWPAPSLPAFQRMAAERGAARIGLPIVAGSILAFLFNVTSGTVAMELGVVLVLFACAVERLDVRTRKGGPGCAVTRAAVAAASAAVQHPTISIMEDLVGLTDTVVAMAAVMAAVTRAASSLCRVAAAVAAEVGTEPIFSTPNYPSAN